MPDARTPGLWLVVALLLLVTPGMIALAFDPTPRPPADMIRIPAGPFIFGETSQTVDVPEFYIDRTEVTVEQYAAFVKSSGYVPQGDWKLHTGPGLEHNPVVKVTLRDAMAYAAYYDKRIPTSTEWEKAARGTDGRRYPWGNEWRADAANVNTIGPRAVGLAGGPGRRVDLHAGCSFHDVPRADELDTPFARHRFPLRLAVTQRVRSAGDEDVGIRRAVELR